MLWLALHLPNLSLESCAATRDPAQAHLPLALLHAHQVQHADALALARGVRPGMQRATALALAPDLLLAAADARRDAQALRAVVHVALAFSPAVTWATPAGLRPSSAQADADAQPAATAGLVGVRLEVQASLRYFGGLPRLLGRLRAALAPLGHTVRIASAPTALGAALLAAWGGSLAHGRGDDQADGRTGGRAGGRTDGRAGRRVDAPADDRIDAPVDNLADVLALGPHSTQPAALQTLLDAVPLTLLGPGLQHQAALHGMGLHTLGCLHRLPRDGLARRFGPALLDQIDRARGHAPEAHHWLTLPPTFDARIELLCRADTSAQVLAGAQVLLARLLAWAGARQARIGRFSLVMHHEPRRRDPGGAGSTTLDINLAEPVADAKHLHSLLAERLGRLPLAAPALELSLRCSHLVLAAAPNGELFASRSTEREGLARLVERLQARLGTAQVLSLRPVPDHRPECGTHWQPADPARLGAAPPAAPAAAALATAPDTAANMVANSALGTPPHSGGLPAAHPLAGQPLWLLPDPQALAERGQVPLLDGQLLQLLAGPDRLEYGWWSAEGPAVRDYFIARTSSGALVWVYRHRLPPRPGAAAGPAWFLQGRFA